jgi:hypothetical protein
MDKAKMMMFVAMAVACAGFATLSQTARADDSAFDLDPKFRARIAKEKVKQNTLQQQANRNGQGAGGSDASCGSQSIGNVNTGGRIGSTPREIFVFAPNAINLVSGQGCK